MTGNRGLAYNEMEMGKARGSDLLLHCRVREAAVVPVTELVELSQRRDCQV